MMTGIGGPKGAVGDLRLLKHLRDLSSPDVTYIGI